MFSLEKLIFVIILSVSILSMQVYIVQSDKFSLETLAPVIENSIEEFAPPGMKTLLIFGLGLFTGIAYDSAGENETQFDHAAAFEELRIRFDNRFDIIASLVYNESQRVISTLIKYSDEKTIFNEGLLKLSELRREYKTQFLRCVKQKKCDKETRQELINDFVGKGPQKLSEILRRFVFRDQTEDQGKRIFEVILQSFNYEDEYGQKSPCADEIQRRQIYIYHIYFHIYGIIIQQYEKILFSQAQKYKNKKSVGSTDVNRTLAFMENTFNDMKEDLKYTTEAARLVLKKIPRDFTRLCDPKTHERGKTYDQLTHFIQAYVVPEKRLRSGPTIGDDKTYFDTECEKPFFRPRSRYECYTYRQLVNCEYLANSVPLISWKDYFGKGYGMEFIKVRNESGSEGKEYGTFYYNMKWQTLSDYVKEYASLKKKPGYLSELEIFKIMVDKESQMHPFYICQLDSLNPNYLGLKTKNPAGKEWLRTSPDFYEVNDKTVRKFSELPVRVSSGKVLTGIRFRVLDRIIYMQIQQGSYINGSIDPASLEWKKIIENREKVQTLNIYRRSFNLDDVEVPSGSFVTGVQFVFNQDTIALGVFGTKVDRNGEVSYNEIEYNIQTEFYPPPFNSNVRQEIKLEAAGPSENAPTDIRHKIISKPGINFVKFQLTDPRKNLQTTVPYLDIRDVVYNKSEPLGGIGIEYRGKEGYGGFIGLKLIFTDVNPKLNVCELVTDFDIKNTLKIQLEQWIPCLINTMTNHHDNSTA